MFQIQLRYFQYVLSLAIFIGILISSKPLITACFVGLSLVWLTEMLIGQFDLKSEQYYVILTVLLISFSTIAFQSIFSEINTSILLITCILISRVGAQCLMRMLFCAFHTVNIMFSAPVRCRLEWPAWSARRVFVETCDKITIRNCATKPLCDAKWLRWSGCSR